MSSVSTSERNGNGAGAWDGIVCFANDWTADPLSKKHLMLRFARSRKILWINSVNNRRPQLATKDMRRIWEKLSGFRQGLKQVDQSIWVLNPLYIPFHGNPTVRAMNRHLLGIQIRRALSRLKIRYPITYTFAPTSADVAGTLGETKIVYHCVDEFAAFSDAGSEVAARERELLQKSDIVLCSAGALFDRKKPYNANTHLITHGVDYDFFRKTVDPTTPVADELKALKKPVLGFTGLIADWVDLPVITQLAKRHPEWSIVLIGRADTDISMLAGIPNIHLLGHRPYSRLPEYLRGFDIALLPFVNNELTVNANPLKLREYMAAGLPVVATPIPEVARYGAHVELASTADEYEQKIKGLLASGAVGPSAERSAAMASESWDAKVVEIEKLLNGSKSAGVAMQ